MVMAIRKLFYTHVSVYTPASCMYWLGTEDSKSPVLQGWYPGKSVRIMVLGNNIENM
jgi:hypothetical protein